MIGALRHRHFYHRTWAIGCTLVLAVSPVFAFNIVLDQNSKSHGLPLDGKNRVELIENDGWITIWLKTRERGVGGDAFEYRIHQDEENQGTKLAFPERDGGGFELNKDLYGFARTADLFEEDEDMGGSEERYRAGTETPSVGNVRYGNDLPLVRVHSEVLASAPPNYVKNPGLRYRISIEGLAVAQDYQRMFEVDAHDAVDAVQGEIMRIANNTYGIERDALFYGAILTVRALNESRKLPADIPDTILRSEVGQIRILGKGLQRGSVNAIGRFSSAGQGQDYARNLGETFGAPTLDPERIHGPRRNRGDSRAVQVETAYDAGKFNPGQDFEEHRRRANTANFRQQRDATGGRQTSIANEQYRRPGLALDKPLDKDVRPMVKNELENREILFGPVKSTAEVRAEGGVPGRLRRQSPQERQTR